MRKYQVLLKGNSRPVEVQAADVELNSTDSDPLTAFWNFLSDTDDDDAVTVAAFPYANVEYIVSA